MMRLLQLSWTVVLAMLGEILKRTTFIDTLWEGTILHTSFDAAHTFLVLILHHQSLENGVFGLEAFKLSYTVEYQISQNND